MQRDGDHVVISVTDTGIGIASDMLEQVFEMFVQIQR
jgi:signal transduction histidine kinase